MAPWPWLICGLRRRSQSALGACGSEECPIELLAVPVTDPAPKHIDSAGNTGGDRKESQRIQPPFDALRRGETFAAGGGLPVRLHPIQIDGPPVGAAARNVGGSYSIRSVTAARPASKAFYCRLALRLPVEPERV
jgi:hypothetical protein